MFHTSCHHIHRRENKYYLYIKYKLPLLFLQVDNIFDYLKIGQEVFVQVVDYDEYSGKASLSTRTLEEEQQKIKDDALEEEFDLASEKELLEWSRSDSPVRMYLREMGQISLLTKDEEIDISKKIEFGEDIIIDAFCSVPYLIDFILDYKEALINRERRVKELFKTFEDDADDDGDDEEFDDEEGEEGEEKKTFSKKDNTRTEKVIESFKSLEKAKKDWLKSLTRPPEENLDDPEEMMNYDLGLAYKKKLLKDALMDLGPTSKLINELVKSMETALKSDFEFDKELKRLEYRLPLFNDTLRENHAKLL
jgi:RNA polymerase primary sigma factor